MPVPRRLGATLTALAALGAVAGGCESTPVASQEPQAQASGGTLRILQTGEFAHLDPARFFAPSGQNFSRLLFRTLTTYRVAPGTGAATVVPDLATDTGRSADDGRTWTFTLRPGVAFQGGRPITSRDVKYGVERSFDPALAGGPRYAADLLANVPRGYAGPARSGTGLASIVTPDARTVVFHLRRPAADFRYTVALSTFSPVPADEDSGAAYDRAPVSSGPYQVGSFQPGRQLVLVRNSAWTAASDPVRRAYPDSVVVDFNQDPSVVDQRLLADAGDDRAATELDSSVGPQNLGRVRRNAGLRRRAVIGTAPDTQFLAINTARVANVRVRRAIEYAVDRSAYRSALGGEAAGEYATTMLSPSLPGHLDFSLYGDTPDAPSVDAARQQLAAAMVTLPVRLTLATSTQDRGLASAVALQQALTQAGFEVTLQRLTPKVSAARQGNPRMAADLSVFDWSPDWPSGSTVLPPLFDGRRIAAAGNTNVSQLNDPAINAAMDRTAAIPDAAAQAARWGALDRLIMQRAPAVPLLHTGVMQLHGSRVRGGYLSAAYGEVDVVALSVS